jgi:hypothetical protein
VPDPRHPSGQRSLASSSAVNSTAAVRSAASKVVDFRSYALRRDFADAAVAVSSWASASIATEPQNKMYRFSFRKPRIVDLIQPLDVVSRWETPATFFIRNRHVSFDQGSHRHPQRLRLLILGTAVRSQNDRLSPVSSRKLQL